MSTWFQLQILLSGVLSGWILFQTAFVAPTVFTKVPESARPVFLRSIFPKLFRATAVVGILLLLTTIFDSNAPLVVYVVGAVTFASGFICFAIVPATNKAKDDGDSERFALLHKISVLLTMATLILNLGWVFVV